MRDLDTFFLFLLHTISNHCYLFRPSPLLTLAFFFRIFFFLYCKLSLTVNVSFFDPVYSRRLFAFFSRVRSSYLLHHPRPFHRVIDVFPCFAFQVIDPYVKVDFHGIPADTASFKTKVVKDNGEQIQLIAHRYTVHRTCPLCSYSLGVPISQTSGKVFIVYCNILAHSTLGCLKLISTCCCFVFM